MKHFLLAIGLCCFQLVLCQPTPAVDFLSADISLAFNPQQKAINGSVTYTLQANTKVDSIALDARNLRFTEVLLKGKKATYDYSNNRLTIHKKLKAGKSYTLKLTYKATPKQAVYFLGWDDAVEGNEQIWTQGQGKYTSNWLPSFDDMNEKVVFDIDITFNKNYEVIANGELEQVKEIGDDKIWSYNMKQPMSSYLLAFAVGQYDHKSLQSENGVPLLVYYDPADSLKAEPTYRYTKEIFDFLEREIGVPYPWQNYKQIPVRDFLYAGMENTGTTIFSNSFVIDSVAFVDRNYVNINAHELAHQWFGNLVTETDGNHHWLHEGFATYYAYLAEKALFGKEHFYWTLFHTAKQLQKQSKDGAGEALTDPKASSLTFYEKGAWALYALRSEIGEKAFKKGIKMFLERYAFKNARIAEFMQIMHEASGRDLQKFKSVWLTTTEFPFQKAKELLSEANPMIKAFFDLQWELTTSREENEVIIKRHWDRGPSSEFKKNVVLQYTRSFSESFLNELLRTDDLKVRQAVAVTTERIPPQLKENFETLLGDASYTTVENALLKLWIHFPESRAQYLEKTRNIDGFPDKNVRLLWWLLASLTPDFETLEKRKAYRAKLLAHTDRQYSFEVRQNAFSLIGEVFKFEDKNLKDLMNASVHPSWQFRKFARGLIDRLLQDPAQKQRFQQLSEELKEEELRYIRTKLDVE